MVQGPEQQERRERAWSQRRSWGAQQGPGARDQHWWGRSIYGEHRNRGMKDRDGQTAVREGRSWGQNGWIEIRKIPVGWRQRDGRRRGGSR